MAPNKSDDGWQDSERGVQPRLSTNQWRSSAELARDTKLGSQNPFRDPHHATVEDDHESDRHTDNGHHASANVAEPQHTHANHRASVSPTIPKAPSPFVTHLPPPHESGIEYNQRVAKIYLWVRSTLQVMFFLLGLLGFLFSTPKATFRSMLTSNAMSFTLLWGLILVFVFVMYGRLNRANDEKTQWRRIGRMLMYDLVIVAMWLIMTWLNSRTAQMAVDEAVSRTMKQKCPGRLSRPRPSPTPSPRPTGRP